MDYANFLALCFDIKFIAEDRLSENGTTDNNFYYPLSLVII